MRGRTWGMEAQTIAFCVAWAIGLLIFIAILNALTTTK